MRLQFRLTLATAAVLALLAPAAWAQEKPAQRVRPIKGKVTYKGRPLPDGVIGFWSEQHTVKTSIEKDGSYDLPSLPVGEYRITVSTKHLKGKPGYVALPEKYGSQKTSGLKVQVKPGQNIYDVKLD